ncbi:MAG: hypothetical protein AAGH15_01550 [Myxococcota bacterium]
MRLPFAILVLAGCTSTVVSTGDAGAPERDARITLPDDAATDLPPEEGVDPLADADGDGLTDREERLAEGLDSDGDGIPDGLDLDSDGNGRSDSLDAFRDATGALGDLDGDGIPDFRDADDDGDFIPDVEELGPDAIAARDTDGDGAEDFRDRDSDGDTILDAEEYNPDFPDADGDGLPNQLDLDSDGDGFSDADEAGDDDLETEPVDTDLDGTPDYLDLDSDDDGLADDFERELGLSPTSGDSDGDGESDLVEAGAGTDGRDPADTVAARGWRVILVPFRQPAEPAELAPALTFDVPADTVPMAVGLELRDVDGALRFIDRIEVDTTSEGCAAEPSRDGDGDGFDDEFVAPAPGSRLCWRVVVRPNRTVPARNWVVNPECERRDHVSEATLAVRGAADPRPATRLFAIIPPDSCLIGPDDGRCFACDLDDPCLPRGGCPCFC